MAEELILKACNVSGCHRPAFMGGRCRQHHQHWQADNVERAQRQIAERNAALAEPPKDHGIIFQPAMVKALLATWKTETRRLPDSPLARAREGDRLWVRESFWLWSGNGHDAELSFADGSVRAVGPSDVPEGKPLVSYFKNVDKSREKGKRISIPAIHMPRWASRITLRVVEARKHNAKILTESEAFAEGARVQPDGMVGFEDTDIRAPSAVEAYAQLWDRMHADQPWASNPYVLAIRFRFGRFNIDKAPCDLCAHVCRGHGFGEGDADRGWQPEPGSRAWAAKQQGGANGR